MINIPYRAFTIKYNGKSDRIITDIKVSQAFDPKEFPNLNQHKLFPTKALWDTGATRSIITANTVNELQLESKGSANVNHFKGTVSAKTYLVNLFLPNKVIMVGTLVCEAEIVENFGVIIGMDIIGQGDFSITNVNNLTWMSYRIPSTKSIDYVEESNRKMFSGVGRNAPCPCGKKDSSGKPVKFKHCHGKK